MSAAAGFYYRYPSIISCIHIFIIFALGDECTGNKALDTEPDGRHLSVHATAMPVGLRVFTNGDRAAHPTAAMVWLGYRDAGRAPGRSVFIAVINEFGHIPLKP